MQRRACRQCLMRELLSREEYERTVERVRRALPASARTDEAEYERRLSLCAACEHLQNGTCMRCGCMAEVRAMRNDTHCPPPLRRW